MTEETTKKDVLDCVKVLDEHSKISHFNIIEVIDGPFKGFKYTYADVAFDEKNEGVLNFTYFIEEGSKLAENLENTEAFHKFLCDVLVRFIENSIKENTVLYHGGS